MAPVTPETSSTIDDFEAQVEATIARWHGIAPPNDPARRMAADLISTIRAFEALRGSLAFEDEPSSFDAELHEAKE